MQVVENWARVTGRIVSWAPPAGEDMPGELVVDVERVELVCRESGTAWPNLLEKAEGRRLRVRVPPSAAAGLKARQGAAIAVTVRRGREPGLVFANPETLDVRASE
jgi:hypothetical protein